MKPLKYCESTIFQLKKKNMLLHFSTNYCVKKLTITKKPEEKIISTVNKH